MSFAADSSSVDVVVGGEASCVSLLFEPVTTAVVVISNVCIAVVEAVAFDFVRRVR